ncbi:hypothetical protein XA68_11671 [Ophiocordyceps unilateralis]|uniref:WSC domain-containing protein n=1 Tax=Ophiocordyceps unilateralis TaxID=268505 RepID=A0A2A9PGC6_OPHUN|nr:hypothetical protein XA68_11671 [Ophiocordyceps unilateralis]
MAAFSTGARRCLSPLLVLLAWPALVLSLDFELCASFNTADSPQNVSIYQTNGLCHDYCMKKSQAYAITQGNSCWCSNYTPAEETQVDKSKCDRPCPAYPQEFCGGKGVFGYIPLNNMVPAGTKGASQSDEATSTSASSSSAETPTATAWVTKTVQDTVTPSPRSSSSSRSSVVPRSSAEESSSTDSPPPSPTSSSSSALPTSVVQTVTADGKVQTVTVMPTQSPTANATKETTSVRMEQSGLGKGAVVGLVVGIIAAAAATAAMGLYMWMQRKKRREENYMDDPSVRGSSSGILGGRPEMSGIPGSPESTGNRSSTLQIDPRMDPFKQGLYARSGSHESINTLRDEHDYSRRIQQPKVLRAMNPDPVAED